jgi:Flp pilus assembly protein CpaB
MSRGWTGALAVVLAVMATLTAYVYLRGEKHTTTPPAGTEVVVVATQDVPVGADLGSLAGSSFTTQQVPKNDVVPGAITHLSQLQDHRSSSVIFQGEQVPSERLKSVSRQPGGVLGLPSGYQATSMDIEAQRVVGGVPAIGDEVAVWAVVTDNSNNQSWIVQITSGAKILRISNTESATTGSGTATTQSGTGYRITLALKQSQVERLVLDHNVGKTYMSLLRPGAKPLKAQPLSIARQVGGR